jgi:hypothetical protein
MILYKRAALVLSLAALMASCNQTPTQEALQADNAASQDLRSQPKFDTLQPGKFQSIHQDLKINLVFVGYNKGDGPREVDLNAFKKVLPSKYKAINRIPSLYGAPEYTGNNFGYDYKIKFADKSFENAFFKHLSNIAVEKPLTVFQAAYNCQGTAPCPTNATNIGKVIDKSYWIDAPKVEKWLAYNAPERLGVNTKDYTVFLINWFDRPDFKFHVYTKTDEPDPDTNYNFGELRSSRKMVAWGGTTPDDKQSGLGKLARLWFFDLSAGPEFSSSMYDITNADIDGDNVTDYRMPPIWDYGSTKPTYRPFNNLSGDLGKIVRYVAIDLLFTTSPIYRVGLTQPVLPDTVKLVTNVYQGVPGLDGKSLIKKDLFLEQVKKLQPLTEFKLELKDQVYTPEAKRTYECVANNTTCYPDAFGGFPGASIFIYSLLNFDKLIGFDQKNYELPIVAYTVPDNVPIPYLGLADDDYQTGTQSFVNGVVTPDTAQFYGLTTTLIHEVGHHLALSHPHDGFDFQDNVDFGTTGDFTYSWLGDSSNSMMSYKDVNWDFSQFDRDNMNRYLVATYINQSNVILGDLLKTPKAKFVRGALSAADRLAEQALDSYHDMRYFEASFAAKTAYKIVLESAKAVGVPLKPFRWYEAYGISPAALSPTRQNEYYEDAQRALKQRMAP